MLIGIMTQSMQRKELLGFGTVTAMLNKSYEVNIIVLLYRVTQLQMWICVCEEIL